MSYGWLKSAIFSLCSMSEHLVENETAVLCKFGGDPFATFLTWLVNEWHRFVEMGYDICCHLNGSWLFDCNRWGAKEICKSEGITIYAEVKNTNSLEGITRHLVNISRLWVQGCAGSTKLDGTTGCLLLNFFQWYLMRPICSVCCFVMQWPAEHRRCQDTRGAATYLTSHMEGSCLLYYQGELIHPRETLHLCTPHSLCDQSTHTHLLCYSAWAVEQAPGKSTS